MEEKYKPSDQYVTNNPRWSTALYDTWRRLAKPWDDVMEYYQSHTSFSDLHETQQQSWLLHGGQDSENTKHSAKRFWVQNWRRINWQITCQLWTMLGPAMSIDNLDSKTKPGETERAVSRATKDRVTGLLDKYHQISEPREVYMYIVPQSEWSETKNMVDDFCTILHTSLANSRAEWRDAKAKHQAKSDELQTIRADIGKHRAATYELLSTIERVKRSHDTLARLFRDNGLTQRA